MLAENQNTFFLNDEWKLASLQLLPVGLGSAFWSCPPQAHDSPDVSGSSSLLSFLLDSLPFTLSLNLFC